LKIIRLAKFRSAMTLSYVYTTVVASCSHYGPSPQLGPETLNSLIITRILYSDST